MIATEQGATVQPILSPDAAAMRQHLEHLFGGDLDGAHDGLVELAWTDGSDGRLRHAALYATDELDELVERAVEVNRIPNQNAYIGAALRKPGTFPGARCEDADFYALPAYYVDLDEPGAAERARALYRGCRPTLAVVTGRRPHLRAQLWWRHESPDRDPVHTRAQLAALAEALAADRTVVNPARVMRLAGSIAWPLKPFRELERTELQVFTDDRPRQYCNGELGRAFPVDPLLVDQSGAPPAHAALPAAPSPAPAAAPPVGSGSLNLQPFTGTSPDELIARIRSGAGGWHNDVLRLVGHYVAVGLSDETILTVCEALTLPGYTAKQTRDDARKMIRGARDKWHIPNPQIRLDDAEKRIEAIEILDLDAVAAIPPVTWQVEGYIPAGAFSLVYGPPGSCKSFLTLDLLLSVAYGQPWHGRPTKPGATLYIAGEGVGGLKKRIAAWRRHHQLTDVWTPFYVIRTGVNLTKPGEVDRLVTAIAAKAAEEGTTFSLVAVDTVARAMAGADENTAQDMGAFIEACDRIRAATGAGLIAVHHSGKDRERGARGSTALPGAVDTSIKVERPEGASFVTVKVEKQKDAEEVAAVTFHLAKVAAGDLNLEEETSLVIVDADGTMPAPDVNKERLSKEKARQVFGWIKAAWEDGMPMTMASNVKLRGRYLVHVMMSRLECSKETAEEHIQAWIDNGYLVEDVAARKGRKTGLRVAQDLV